NRSREEHRNKLITINVSIPNGTSKSMAGRSSSHADSRTESEIKNTIFKTPKERANCPSSDAVNTAGRPTCRNTRKSYHIDVAKTMRKMGPESRALASYNKLSAPLKASTFPQR